MLCASCHRCKGECPSGKGLSMRRIFKSACMSACGTFRYRLERRWGDGPALLYIMLNPSTANSEVDDPTIRRCQHFALAHRFDALEVVNLFAFRATKPADLRRAGYPVGRANDQHIVQAAAVSGAVCLAWGASAGSPEVAQRVNALLPMLRQHMQLQCLHITRSGHPGHPLMLRNDCRLQPFSLDAIDAAMHGHDFASTVLPPRPVPGTPPHCPRPSWY